ncbi:hypothetical protein ERY13_11095 [Paenibacillus mucilaginosus]|nr:hypothetical protein ERY13_11095 [Paenibacillus mucilaginosus]
MGEEIRSRRCGCFKGWPGAKEGPEEMTEADRQKLEMKKMEYEMERLRAENAFLKKLREIQRRRS